MSGTHRSIRLLLSGALCIALLGLAVVSTAGAQETPERTTVSGELELASAEAFPQRGAETFFARERATGTSTTDRSTTAGASHAYTVHALDAVGRGSGASHAVGRTLGGTSDGLVGGGSGGSGGDGGKGNNW